RSCLFRWVGPSCGLQERPILLKLSDELTIWWMGPTMADTHPAVRTGQRAEGAGGAGGGRRADDLAGKRRSATVGAFFAEFVDMFDIYLPTVILTPALAYFQPARLSPGQIAIFTSLVFATTRIGRPVGAAIFGALADRVGRRRTTITSVTGFGVITLLIALVPGHAD